MSAVLTERQQKGQERMAEILSRSVSDIAFRQQLIADPRAALSAHFGREMPETFKVRFVDAQGTPTVVLPEATTGELSEADLEAVAGGIIPALIGAGAAIYCFGDHVGWW